MLETAWESRWLPDSNGGVAQLGEHLPCKQGVKSSNLSISTRPKVSFKQTCLKRENMIRGANPIAKQFRMDLRQYMRPKVECTLKTEYRSEYQRVKDRELIDES